MSAARSRLGCPDSGGVTPISRPPSVRPHPPRPPRSSIYSTTKHCVARPKHASTVGRRGDSTFYQCRPRPTASPFAGRPTAKRKGARLHRSPAWPRHWRSSRNSRLRKFRERIGADRRPARSPLLSLPNNLCFLLLPARCRRCRSRVRVQHLCGKRSAMVDAIDRHLRPGQPKQGWSAVCLRAAHCLRREKRLAAGCWPPAAGCLKPGPSQWPRVAPIRLMRRGKVQPCPPRLETARAGLHPRAPTA